MDQHICVCAAIKHNLAHSGMWLYVHGLWQSLERGGQSVEQLVLSLSSVVSPRIWILVVILGPHKSPIRRADRRAVIGQSSDSANAKAIVADGRKGAGDVCRRVLLGG